MNPAEGLDSATDDAPAADEDRATGDRATGDRATGDSKAIEEQTAETAVPGPAVTDPGDQAIGESQSGLGAQLEALAAAVTAAEDRIDDATLQRARDLTGRASDRLRMSGEHTIVALAGATGSGKSSLFNVLTDLDLAGVGVRRPTTSWALACAWGPDGAEELLSWMGVPPRHQVSRMGMLDRNSEDSSLEGLILLDLPDHDSTEVSHHVEMDRLVAHSDLLIWVLDPQKYADAAIHERYIRKMADLGAVTLVVLNQIDRISYGERETTLADVKRLVEDDGLAGVKVLGVSATRGDGLDELRRELADHVSAKSAARTRLAADVANAAQRLADKGGTAPRPTIPDSARVKFTDSLADSAGITHAGERVLAATNARVARLCSWPPAQLLRRDRAESATEIAPAQQAAADLAVREFIDTVSADLKLPWRTAVRGSVQRTAVRGSVQRTAVRGSVQGTAVRGSVQGTAEIDDAKAPGIAGALDQAVRDRGVRLNSTPFWARMAQTIQWFLFALLVVGLAGVGVWLYQFSTGAEPNWRATSIVAGVPVSGWLAIGALLAGLVVHFGGRRLAASTARNVAESTGTQLRSAVDDVVTNRVIAPLESELDRYEAYRAAVEKASNDQRDSTK